MTGNPVGRPQIRVGQGFDIHRFSEDPDRKLILGGCEFPGERGLVGHSDADAVAHAVADALLGAAGLGDIGQQFPDTDPQWKGADSIQLLAKVAEMIGEAGYAIGNVDCSVVCERPKIAPRKAEMQQILSVAAGAPVTVSGRRAEGLGAIGRTEGVMCLAVAIIVSLGASTGTA
jgi:2-C-methyl-D-erythritol 2,4-cyclodiphosphate synthase